MTRESAAHLIQDVLYGTDTETGHRLLSDLVAEMGLDALSDEAVVRLAAMHQEHHDAELARWERGRAARR